MLYAEQAERYVSVRNAAFPMCSSPGQRLVAPLGRLFFQQNGPSSALPCKPFCLQEQRRYTSFPRLYTYHAMFTPASWSTPSPWAVIAEPLGGSLISVRKEP